MQSENINELAGALAKAQGSIKAAAKAKDNPFFKSKYADLPAIWEACRASLSENGIAVIQSPLQHENGEMYLETTMAHSSGQWMKSVYPIRPTKNDPQGVASAITYARRYSLSAMVGVVADEDDDGNAASQPTAANGPAPAQVNTQKISPKQSETLLGLIASTDSDIEIFCKHFGIEAVPDMPSSKYEDAVSALNRKKKKAA